MKITLLTVGKLKEQFYREAVAEYAKRLSRFCKFNVIEIEECRAQGNSPKDIEKVVYTESRALQSKLCGYTIIMDLQGKMVDSCDIASDISRITLEGDSDITFVIGGSHGMDRELVSKANASYCFGKITFPHQLMRVVVCEQIYRAFMINLGSEYHK